MPVAKRLVRVLQRADQALVVVGAPGRGDEAPRPRHEVEQAQVRVDRGHVRARPRRW